MIGGCIFSCRGGGTIANASQPVRSFEGERPSLRSPMLVACSDLFEKGEKGWSWHRRHLLRGIILLLVVVGSLWWRREKLLPACGQTDDHKVVIPATSQQAETKSIHCQVAFQSPGARATEVYRYLDCVVREERTRIFVWL